MIQKVVAYVTRQCRGRTELLVFAHPDFPAAGIQVPAGTVENGEVPEQALRRELTEETGQTGFVLLRQLGVYDYLPPDAGTFLRRHVYHLRAPSALPDRWRWGERVGTPEQISFDFYWVPLNRPPLLSGGLGHYLGELAER